MAWTPRCSTTLMPSLSVQRSGVKGMTAASAPAAGAASASSEPNVEAMARAAIEAGEKKRRARVSMARA